MSAKQSEHSRLASFSERTVAFGLDALPFLAAYWLVSGFVLLPIQAAVQDGFWRLFWVGLFLAYQAYFSSEGRVSLGKRVIGLQVLDGDHEPLGLAAALIRSVLYPISSILGLGFAWSLFNPTHQAWHDLAVGSVVVASRRHRVQSHVGAAVFLSLIGLSIAWEGVWQPRYHRLMDLAGAQIGMKHVSTLQRMYRSKHGRYANNLIALSTMSADPENFLLNIATLYDLDKGFKIEARRDRYVVLARANDSRRTPIKFVGS